MIPIKNELGQILTDQSLDKFINAMSTCKWKQSNFIHALNQLILIRVVELWIYEDKIAVNVSS